MKSTKQTNEKESRKHTKRMFATFRCNSSFIYSLYKSSKILRPTPIR